MQANVSEQEDSLQEHQCTYDSATQTIVLAGMLRLDGLKAYEPIVEFLENVVSRAPDHLTLDIRELEYLNSSGIAVLSRFVLGLHRQGNIQLTVKASSQVTWQARSVRNLLRLMPDAELEFC
ncbi:MAG: hypothetical protein NZ772_11290 [Cyanobacteria bacterium]|nr:hypothetical protein [Cyanobacteriota bacterium]MDW8202017.1 hypothetical protein [Cyanobacteriota bacterium SKYGB_h_bin112]